MKIDLTLLIGTRGGCRERQGDLDQVHEHASGFLGVDLGIQKIAADESFMSFMYYSPFRYAYRSNLHGFVVYPLGNYHLEDAWLGQ